MLRPLLHREGNKRMKHAHNALGMLALALGLGMATPTLAQAVVVRSTGPSAASFPAGKRLAANGSVTLQAGDVVTVLDKVGTRVLRGQGTFAVDGPLNRDRGSAALLARSLSNPVSVRAGAVRGAPGDVTSGEPIPVSVWLADIDKGGRVCLPRGSDLYLWRGVSAQRRFVWLGESDGGGTVRVALPSRTAGVAWPQTMVPLADGHTYRVTDEADPNKGTELRLVLLEPEVIPADAVALGTLLLDNGCKAQFEWLAASLESDDASGLAASGS
jgi:hypothetical protein